MALSRRTLLGAAAGAVLGALGLDRIPAGARPATKLHRRVALRASRPTFARPGRIKLSGYAYDLGGQTVHEITHIEIVPPITASGVVGDGQVVIYDVAMPDIVVPVTGDMAVTPMLGESLPRSLSARVSIPTFGGVPRAEWRGPGDAEVQTRFTPVDLVRIGLL